MSGIVSQAGVTRGSSRKGDRDCTSKVSLDRYDPELGRLAPRSGESLIEFDEMIFQYR